MNILFGQKMTRDEIITKVDTLAARREEHWKDDQKLRHFAQRLESVEDEIVFEALMSFFETDPYANSGYDRQDIAGTLLVLRRPKPTWELSTILDTSAANYDLSIEQLPWYLALHYGRESFRYAVRVSMKNKALSEKEHRALNTYLYWTRASEERILKELEYAED